MLSLWRGRLCRTCRCYAFKAGGEYVYLTEAYGPLWGFLTAGRRCGSPKAIHRYPRHRAAFFEYTAYFVPQFERVWFTAGPFSVKYGQVFALALILALGGINYLGVRIGGDVQVAVTAVKIALIAFVILAGLLYPIRRQAPHRRPPHRRYSPALSPRLWVLCGLMTAGITSGWWLRKSKIRNGTCRSR